MIACISSGILDRFDCGLMQHKFFSAVVCYVCYGTIVVIIIGLFEKEDHSDYGLAFFSKNGNLFSREEGVFQYIVHVSHYSSSFL